MDVDSVDACVDFHDKVVVGLKERWEMKEDDLVDRRQFAQRLVLGTGLTVGATAIPALTAEPPLAVPPAPKLPVDVGGDTPAPPPEILLLSYLVRTCPSEHFDEPTVAGIFRDIRSDVARGQLLAQFPLTNADEPAFVFTPYRSDPRV